MAGRTSQVVREILAQPTTQKARTSQVAREVLALPSTQKARISQVVREIILDIWGFNLSDSFSLVDAIILAFNEGYPFSDSLDNFLDDVSTNLVPVEFPQWEANVADSVVISDSLAYEYLIFDFPSNASIGDSGNYFNDGIAFTLAPEVIYIAIDDLNWSSSDFVEIDFRQSILALSVEAYDTLFYDMFDEVGAKLVSSRSFVDSLTLTDKISCLLNWLSTNSDTLSLSDLLNAVDGDIHDPFSDTMAMSDSVTASVLEGLELNVDDLFLLSDLLDSPLVNVTLTSYLRRYLNDVLRV